MKKLAIKVDSAVEVSSSNGLSGAVYFFFYREIYHSALNGLVKISHPLSSNTALIIYGSIAGLFFLVIIINKIRKIESFVAGKETVVSFLKKKCARRLKLESKSKLVYFFENFKKG